MQQQSNKPRGIERPVDNLKFTAYKNIIEDKKNLAGDIVKTAYEQAVELIIAKHPVLGEPVVVPIRYRHSDGVETIELVFGIGSADEEHPYIACSVNNNIGDEIKISDKDSSTGFVTLKEKFESVIKNASDEVVDIILHDVDFKEEFIASLMEGPTIENAIETKVQETLRWKSLTSLLN